MVFGAGRLPAGHWFAWHDHPQHQIVWAARGVLAVNVQDWHWILPPTRGLWVPAGTVHRTGASGETDMRGIFLEPSRSTIAWRHPTMFTVSGLLRELFEHLTVGDVDAAERARAEAVVFDLMKPAEVVPIGARMPTDPRALRIAETLLATPADGRPLRDFCELASASERTLARVWVAETGLGFGRWRTQIRLAAALPLLADNAPLAGVAHRVGYATASAFIAAFRREVGISPGRYFAA